MPARRFARWIIYIVELLVLYVLQTTPGLIPEVMGVRPVLLVPAALMIAMFEGDIGGMAAGIAAGLLTDMGGSDILGFHGIILGVLCFFLGMLTMELVKTNLLTALLAAVVAVPAVCLLQWVFFYLLPGYAGAQYALLQHYLPKMAVTFAVAPLLYGFNRLFALRLSDAA